MKVNSQYARVVAVQAQPQRLKSQSKALFFIEVKNKMAIGEKLWEGKGKSGASFIKSVGMDGVTSMYTWTAQMKGMGKAKGVDCNLKRDRHEYDSSKRHSSIERPRNAHDYDRRYGHNKRL